MLPYANESFWKIKTSTWQLPEVSFIDSLSELGVTLCDLATVDVKEAGHMIWTSFQVLIHLFNSFGKLNTVFSNEKWKDCKSIGHQLRPSIIFEMYI